MHITEEHPRTAARADWLRAGLAVAAVAWGANQFAPLLLVYRARLGLSEATVAATFGCYAIGLIPALLVCGRLADRFGRRRVLLPALVASIVASVVLIAGGQAPVLLYAGRFVAGLASGAAFSSGAAWIKELSGAQHGPRRVTVTMTAGFAAGPLVAGLLAQWAPAPTAVPYLPHLVLLLAAIALLPQELLPRELTAASSTPKPPRLTELGRPRMRGVALPLAPWVFGAAAVALAYLPGLVQRSLPGSALAYTAIVTMLTALAGIAVQPLARRVSARGRTPLVAMSLGIVVAGLLLAALAAAALSPGLVVVAALVLGAGYGACQVCGLQEVTALARPDSLAALTAVYQAVSYLGFAVPYLLAALATVGAPAMLLTGLAVLALGTMIVTTVASARSAGDAQGGTR